MAIRIVELTEDILRPVLRLKVHPHQENWVASNAVSVAQSRFHLDWLNLAIYDEDTPVGYALCGADTDGSFWIIRLMIDAEHQKKGYGREAIQKLIERFKNDPQLAHLKEIRISFVPSNEVARKLYLSVGFSETGEFDQGEEIFRYPLER
jgi:diamine N-acetyltransferase